MNNNSIPPCSVDGTSAITQSDFMLLLEYGTEKSVMEDMITRAKINYVNRRHTNAIFQMKTASGYKRDKWKTYVGKGKARKELVRKTEDELYSALYDYYHAQEIKPKTLQDVFNALMKYKANVLNRDQNTIYDNTRRFSHVSNALKRKSITDITDEDIQTWLVKDYLPNKPKETSLRKQMQLLGQIFAYGIKKKWCVQNPTIYISVQDYLSKCDLKVKKDEEKAFSEKQLELINAEIEKDINNPRALMTLMAEHTGMRIGELTALHKSDIDLERGFIHVHRQQHKYLNSEGHLVYEQVPYTKDEKKHPHGGRRVPLLPESRRVIKLAMNLPGESEYLLHDDAGKMITEDSYNQNLRKRCQRVVRQIRNNKDLDDDSKRVVENMPTNNHAFRVAFNSRLIDLGLSARERALILGHAVETNERFYSKRDERTLESIASRLARAHLESSLAAKDRSAQKEEPVEELLV